MSLEEAVEHLEKLEHYDRIDEFDQECIAVVTAFVKQASAQLEDCPFCREI